MIGRLCLQNQQRTCRIDTRFLRRITRFLLEPVFNYKTYELGLRLVEDAQMIQANESFLRHAGSTDVITFNYAPPGQTDICQGDILICLDEAKRQARRFRTHWTAELVRYLIHGLLHLRGYDDLKPTARRKMKQEEERLLQLVAEHFPLKKLKGKQQ